MNEELIDDLFAWVDKIPFTRPKKDLKRDFSDGGGYVLNYKYEIGISLIVLSSDIVGTAKLKKIILNTKNMSNLFQNTIKNFEPSKTMFSILQNPQQNITNAVLIAELVKYYYPSYVDLHNYPSALGVNNKIVNWKTLNRLVLTKLYLFLN